MKQPVKVSISAEDLQIKPLQPLFEETKADTAKQVEPQKERTYRKKFLLNTTTEVIEAYANMLKPKERSMEEHFYLALNGALCADDDDTFINLGNDLQMMLNIVAHPCVTDHITEQALIATRLQMENIADTLFKLINFFKNCNTPYWNTVIQLIDIDQDKKHYSEWQLEKITAKYIQRLQTQKKLNSDTN